MDRIPTGLMACREGQPLFKELLHDYDNAHFVKEDGTYDTTTKCNKNYEYLSEIRLAIN